eukprot:1981155-Amphidinium_carterae.1
MSAVYCNSVETAWAAPARMQAVEQMYRNWGDFGGDLGNGEGGVCIKEEVKHGQEISSATVVLHFW